MSTTSKILCFVTGLVLWMLLASCAEPVAPCTETGLWVVVNVEYTSGRVEQVFNDTLPQVCEIGIDEGCVCMEG